MTTIAAILLLILLGTYLSWRVYRTRLQIVERHWTIGILSSALIYFALSVLHYYGFCLKGAYSEIVVSCFFVATVVFYYFLATNKKWKLMLLPVLGTLTVVALVAIGFGRKTYERKIDETHKIVVRSGGVLSCGELMYITESKYGIFDRELFYESSLCLRAIDSIDVVSFDHELVEFHIYHNAELHPENPYRYVVANSHIW